MPHQDRDRRGEAVHEVGAAHWADLAGVEHAGGGEIAQLLLDGRGVVVGLRKHAPTAGTSVRPRFPDPAPANHEHRDDHSQEGSADDANAHQAVDTGEVA